jgi:two-component system cell cycle sensor histidine kinase/response regulator CckA
VIDQISPHDTGWRQFKTRTKDGSVIDTVWANIRLSDGHAIAIGQDITERKRMEEQMRQAQKMEAIGRLAGGIAHDFNNLLSPILGYSDLLLDDKALDADIRQSMNEIMRAASRARDLVRQLLAFSRKQTLEFKPVDINKTVDKFEELLRRTLPEDIHISAELCPDLPPARADIGQIEQIIMNLAVNAADAMPDGGELMIRTSLSHPDDEQGAISVDSQPGPCIVLTMADTGHGMDKEIREHIFEPFFTTKGEQGTGLGLATVFGIVQQHNGKIWLKSEPSKGTAFKIYLPASGDTHVAESADEIQTSTLKGTETILLVEDNEQVRHLANIILKKQGYNVLVARDSEEALELLGRHDGLVDLLLTDVVLPGMNGKELYEKAVQSYGNLKVLYMSGYTEDLIAHRGVLDEGIHFIQKPFSVRSLASKIRQVLNLYDAKS